MNRKKWIIISIVFLLIVQPFYTVIGSSHEAFAEGDGTQENPYQIPITTQLNEVENQPNSTEIANDSVTNNPPSEGSCVSGGGDGLTIDNPIIICTPEDLDKIREGLNKNYKLGQDIDLESFLSEGGPGYNNGKGWIPIGNPESSSTYFTGTFDGNNYEIKNLKINRPDEDYIGLFGFVYDYNWQYQFDESRDFDYKTQKVMLKNIKLRNVDINGNREVGGLAGFISLGSTHYASVTGVIKGIYNTGGLLGRNGYSLLTRSWSSADVIGKECTISDDHFFDQCGNTGGLTGINDGRITESFSDANVKGISRVGGFAGSSINRPIMNSYATGKVETLFGNGSIGGFAGKIGSGTKIINSYSIAEVKIPANGNIEVAGGLLGGAFEEVLSSRFIISSYWDVTNSKIEAGERYYGTPITPTTDISKSTFENWDFDNVWYLQCDQNGVYPVLRWTMSEIPAEQSCSGNGTTPPPPTPGGNNDGEDTPTPVPAPTPDSGPTPVPAPAPTPVPESTPDSNPSPTTGNGSSTEIITVDVDGENGELLNKTPIQRTTETNGSVKDFVTMPDTIAKETVLKAKESKNDTARIMIPDAKDIVSETKVEVPKSALSELKSGNLNLEIYTDNVTISIPKASLSDYTDDLYFRLVPIKKEEERQQVEERAKKEEVVKEALGDGSIEVVGRPMTIETNLTSRKVDLILPLQGVALPEDPKEREEYLNNLGIFIEHSDGDRVLVRPVPVEYKEGVQGLKFTIEKFSTFTIVKMDNLDEYFNGLDKDGSNTHKPYIYGFEDGTFRTDAFITRSQMAAMLARNLVGNETNNSLLFKDVNQKNWAYNDILETTNAGIMSGVGSEQFDPKGFVTRAQMASIAYRWMQQECAKDSSVYKDCSTLEDFGSANYKDISNNHWAKEAIDFLKTTDIMIGYNDQTFKPNQKLTRAEAVKVLNRLFKRGPLTGVETPSFKDVSPSYWAFEEIEEAAREHTFTMNQNGHEVLK
ncbi:S-layer homology domain-containing protein [Lysinibacillus antri]|uniref:S-layer homology domain-containing protein n=1 Tax=Lysinibacillus antri TaxID=2498145 RepID=A0A3S0RHX6_9BACI|nr:S-layer homology domain-containing protein [Lysinibacillus antri]RUL49809.1 S-layer homology domain-containing protein [Lysinibacillus antri]